MPTHTPPDLSVAVDAALAPVPPAIVETADPDPGTGTDPDTAAGYLGMAAASTADRPATTGWSPPIDGHGLFKSLMLRLPRGVRRSFDHEQLLALRQAAEEMAWGEHPIDIRLSLPWPGGRSYFLVVAGRERRELSRAAGQRRRSPPIRVGNHASLFTLVGVVVGLTVLIGLAAARLVAG